MYICTHIMYTYFYVHACMAWNTHMLVSRRYDISFVVRAVGCGIVPPAKS
jgi:hypothetical protein